MMRRAIATALVAALLLAGCSGSTTPPVTSKTATSATVHGDVTWTQADHDAGRQWRWEWSRDSFSTVLSTTYATIPSCASDPCSSSIQQNLTGLDPATTYKYRLAMLSGGSTNYGDSDGCCGNPPVYDAFTTLAGYPSLDTITLDGDFNGGQLTGAADGAWDSTPSGNTGTLSLLNAGTNPTPGEGAYGLKALIPSGSSQQRAELAFDSIGPTPTTTFEELVRIPSVANNGPDHGTLNQTKFNGDPSCFDGGLTYNPDDFPGELNWSTVADCGAGSVHHGLGVPPLGTWIGVKVAETFGEHGSVQVWTDDDGAGPDAWVSVLNLPDVNNDPSDGTNTVKYRTGLYADPNGSHETHVYEDGFHLLCSAGC